MITSTQSTPKVFISYSWESEGHKDWVVQLAERLRRNGVNVRLDRWHVSPGQSLTQFMEQEVHTCDFVLVVCTKLYRRKSLEREGGVGYEQQIITGKILAGMARDQFIPIVRDGEFKPGSECSIPEQFLGIYAIDMRDSANVDKSTEELLRAIFKKPALTQPELGPPPIFVDDEGREAEQNHDSVELRLAELEIDGWQLKSGVASHQAWPETFHIPDQHVRRNLVSGDIVKLIFEIFVPGDEDKDDEGSVSNERMWVKLTGKSGPYYIGELNSFPACSEDQEFLHTGDKVVFLPEHVISIFTVDGEEIQIDDSATPK